MHIQLTARHIQDRNGQPLAIVDGFPGLQAEMTRADLLEMSRTLHQMAIDLQWVTSEPPRHPATPGYFEYPTFDESCNFEPAGIDSEGGSHD